MAKWVSDGLVKNEFRATPGARPWNEALLPSFAVATSDASPAKPPRSRVLSLPRVRHAKPEDWAQLVRFCVVGASGFVVNLIVYSLLVHPADVHYMAAAVVAFAVAWTTNFVLNKHWTFRRHGLSTVHQGARNLIVSLIGLAINLVILRVLVEFGVPKVPAQMVAIGALTPVTFLLNRRWSFR